jgi:ParB/RepB/Spo0J family partition protein
MRTPKQAYHNLHVPTVPVASLLPDRLTDFSLDPLPPDLVESIRAIGISHPLTLSLKGKGLRVVCGHRRAQAARLLHLQEIPAWVVGKSPDDLSCLHHNLQENMAQRHYSDIETGRILLKLQNAGAKDMDLVQKYLPLLGREKSKKQLLDLLRITSLPEPLQDTLHSLHCPLRVIGLLFDWDEASHRHVEEIFTALRPGVNKCREFLERVDEIARRDGQTPGEIFSREEIQKTLHDPDRPPPEKFNAIHTFLKKLRYPNLTDLQEQVWRAIDRLQLDNRIKLRVPENFEKELFKIDLQFASAEELQRLAEQLFRASDAQALEDLLQIFRKMK